MSLLIINGSPKAKAGNTEIFIRRFLGGMREPCEVRYAVKDNPQELASYLRGFDTVLFFMPLYVHAMPGIVMRVIEQMKPAEGTRKIGFLVQSGFLEAAQSQYVERYFRVLAGRLQYDYLGTVIHGGSAGVAMMPEKANAELFDNLEKLGGYFEKEGVFEASLVERLAVPGELTQKECAKYERLYRLKLGNTFWYMMLAKNKAFGRRRDKPFAPEA